MARKQCPIHGRKEEIRKTSISWRCDNGKTERMFLYSARGVSLSEKSPSVD